MRGKSAQPGLLLWECCCWRGSHWKRQAGTGPPLQGQGPALPEHTPTFPSHEHSLPSPGNLPPPSRQQHTALPALPAPEPPEHSSIIPAFASWCTGSPASIRASRTFSCSTASLRTEGDRGWSPLSGCRAAPVLISVAQHCWGMSRHDAALDSHCLGSNQEHVGSLQSLPALRHPSGT